MSTRTTWVPLHTILVVRPVDPDEPDGATHQVDALAEYRRTGKAFKFTEAEVKEIMAGYDGNASMALRSPTEEAVSDEGVMLASNETPLADAAKEAADKAAAEKKAADKAKADKAAADKAAADKNAL